MGKIENKKYTHDIIIIGAGSGGLNVAGFMSRADFKVLLIDKQDESIGGDCLNHGCVPSKAMIHASRLVREGKEATRFGVKQSGVVDLAKVVSYVRSKQAIIRKHENASYFRKKGMDVELGEAQFSGAQSVSINGKRYSAKRIVIATGSRPRELPNTIPGVEKISYFTNEQIFDLKVLPNKLLVIGGGPIGMEIGQAFANFGSKVTILERGDTFLPKEAPEIASVLHKQLIEDGVDVMFNTQVKSFPSSKSVIVETTKESKATSSTLSFDAVFVGIGRELNVEKLNLPAAGIQMDESGGRITVTDKLETTNPHVFVCGDVAGGYQFTHAAEVHARVLITNFFSPFKTRVSYDDFAWVTYTYPEIATFGLSEKELKRRDIAYEKFTIGFADDDRAIVDEYQDAKMQVYVRKEKILGGSIASPKAGEISQELILALHAKIPVKYVFGKVCPYPTASRINKTVLREYFARKLTPVSKKLMRWLY